MKLLFFPGILFSLLLSAQTQPVALGDVHWLRSFHDAQAQSGKEGKPILILFQEIPGCSTCQRYGNNVLAQPLIVETIETAFIPLAIYNNNKGEDAEILRMFNEPAWNNPVVRIVNTDGSDIVSRLNGDYSPAGLAGMMCHALTQLHGTAPAYLSLLTEELNTEQHGTATAVYSMYCFWAGEALFGRVNGVVKTTAGYQDGKETVVVEYDPLTITKKELDRLAEVKSCAATSQGSFRPDATPKYYLSHSIYQNVPMLEIQKCRVNSALAEGQSPDVFLSPRQLAVLHPDMSDRD